MTPRSTATAGRAEATLPSIAVTPIAVTLGDPAGIGPDITLQAWRDRNAHALHPYAVYGDAEALRDRARALGLGVAVVVVDRLEQAPQLFAEALPVLRPALRPTAFASPSAIRPSGRSARFRSPIRATPRFWASWPSAIPAVHPSARS